MSNVKAMVGKLLTGQLKLDVPTAQKLIEQVSADERVDGAAELAPLKELFSGDHFKAGVDGSAVGKRMLQGFVLNAAKVHSNVGDAQSAQVRNLKSLSVDYTAQLLSKEAVHDLLKLYRGTTADDPHYDSVNSTTSIREVTPQLAEAWRKAAEKDLRKYLEGGKVQHFFTRLGVGREFIDKVYENDPQDYIRAEEDRRGSRVRRAGQRGEERGRRGREGALRNPLLTRSFGLEAKSWPGAGSARATESIKAQQSSTNSR